MTARPDPKPESFCAQMLIAASGAYAAGAVERLFQADPQLKERWEPNAYTMWSDESRVRIAQLASALRAHRPAIFAAGVRWTARAIFARGAPIADFAASIEALASTIDADLPPNAAQAAKPYFDAAREVLSQDPAAAPSPLDTAGEHAQLATAYLTALLEGKRDHAFSMLREAMHEGADIHTIYLKVLSPALDELGKLWMEGDIHVGEEHFATAATRLLMAQLLAEADKPTPRDDRRILTATVEGNAHEIGIRMIADFFELEGWRSIYLGTSLPPEDLVQTAIDFDANCICLSAMLTTHLDAITDTINALRANERTRRTPIIVGGKAFTDAEDLWSDLGADGNGTTPKQTVELAEQLVSAAQDPSA